MVGIVVCCGGMAESTSTKDLYSVLQIHKDVDDSEIRRSYQKLAKQCHPDKLPADMSEDERAKAVEQFHEITKAYEVLTNKKQRQEYDTKSNEQRLTQKWPINATLDLDEMTFDPKTASFSSPCRCGGYYIISEGDMEEGVELVCCSMCTLSVRVLYQELQEEEEDEEEEED